jgi:hypothetical protein
MHSQTPADDHLPPTFRDELLRSYSSALRLSSSLCFRACSRRRCASRKSSFGWQTIRREDQTAVSSLISPSTPSGFSQALCGVVAANPQPFGYSELIESLLAITDLSIADASSSTLPSSKAQLGTHRAIELVTSVISSVPSSHATLTLRIA